MNKTLLISLLFVLVFLLIVLVLKKRSASRILNKRYSIATIIRKESKKNGTLYHYTFSSNNKDFKGTFRHHANKFALGTRYFVSYDTTNPTQNFLELQYPTPDTITTIPENGWDHIPQ